MFTCLGVKDPSFLIFFCFLCMSTQAFYLLCTISINNTLFCLLYSSLSNSQILCSLDSSIGSFSCTASIKLVTKNSIGTMASSLYVILKGVMHVATLYEVQKARSALSNFWSKSFLLASTIFLSTFTNVLFVDSTYPLHWG